MCKMSEYSALYSRVEEQLRIEGIPKDTPGYELLKKAIVIYKIKKLPKNKLIEEVEKISLVPSSEVDLERKKRSTAEQWMIEAMKTVAIDDDLMVFIDDISNRL